MTHFFVGLLCAALLFMPPLGFSIRIPIWSGLTVWVVMVWVLRLWVGRARVRESVEFGVVMRRARQWFILICAVAAHFFGVSQLLPLFPFPVSHLLLLGFALLLYLIVVLKAEHREAAMDERHPQTLFALTATIRGFLTPTIPFFAVWGFMGLLDAVPPLGEAVWTYRSLLYPGLMVMATLFALGMPFLLLLAIPSNRLEGSLEHHLMKIANRVGVRIRAIYVMRTGPKSIPNASIAGLFGKVRYVFFSEGLVNSPLDEIEAVFAHELGHARLHHPILFLIYGFGFLGAVVWLVVNFWGTGETVATTVGLHPVVWTVLITLTVVMLFFLGFGWISRRLEQTADAYAVSLVGSDVYSTSLMRIWLAAGGMRKLFSHWRHFPLPKRIQTASSLKTSPQTLERIVRSNTFALMLLFFITLVGLLLYLSVAIDDIKLPEWEVAARRIEYASISGRKELAFMRLRKALIKWPNSKRLLNLLDRIEESKNASDGD